MIAVAEQGRLDEMPLPQLLLELHGAGFSGALMLSRERVGKRFLFHAGAPVFAESNLASESLGVQLMDTGRLSRTDYNRMAAHLERSGTKEGAALLELGLLKPKELFLALKEQVRIRLLECFGWPEGSYDIDPSTAPPDDAQAFRVDFFALVQEGLETHWSSDRLLGDLASQMERYVRRGDSFDAMASHLRLDHAVEALLEACDGSRTLWRIIKLAATSRALAAAWLLDAAGALDYADSARDPAAGPELEIVVQRSARGATPARPAPVAVANRTRKAVPDAALAALVREVEAKSERLRELDHYGLLGVPRDASTGEIRRAYLDAAKRYHPDALARLGLPPEQRERANAVFAAISKAHAVLADPDRRNDYDLTQATQDTDLDANRLAQAETLYRKAEVLLRLGNFRGAVEFLRPAVELWPEEAAYQGALGWALYKKLPSEREVARHHLEQAAGLAPDDAEVLLRLSVVLRELGEEEGAAEAEARAGRVGA